MKCEHISASRAELYEQCELRYHVRCELKADNDSDLKKNSGKFIHKVLELYYSPTFTGSIQDAWQQALSVMQCASFPEFKEAEKMVLEAVEANPKKDVVTIDTEIAFDHIFESGLNIVGIIDRIDIMPDNTLRIIDFKTGSMVMPYAEMRESHQANMYTLWAYTKFKDFKRIVFSYFYLREKIFRDVVILYPDALKYKEYLEFLVSQITNNTKPQPTLNRFCWNCGHRNQCPAFKTFSDYIFRGENPFAQDCSDMTIEQVISTIAKLKAGMSILEKDKKGLEAWASCMVDASGGSVKMSDGTTVSLSAKKTIKPDIGVVHQLAKEIGVTEELIDPKAADIDRLFGNNTKAIELIRASSTVEFGTPYLSIGKKRGKE